MYACMHGCMYTCMHACMHACMYVCIDVCVYVCIHVCIFACMCVYVCVTMYERVNEQMHVCMCVCVYECVCVSVCLCVCANVYIYVPWAFLWCGSCVHNSCLPHCPKTRVSFVLMNGNHLYIWPTSCEYMFNMLSMVCMPIVRCIHAISNTKCNVLTSKRALICLNLTYTWVSVYKYVACARICNK